VISWIGFRVVDVYGTRIGRAAAYVADPANHDEDWILVRCGRLTSRSHKLAPFSDAIISNNEIWLPIEISAVLASPSAEAAPPYVSVALLDEVARHYDMPRARRAAGALNGLKLAGDESRLKSPPLATRVGHRGAIS